MPKANDRGGDSRLPVWCSLCTSRYATQRRYPPPDQYRPKEKGTPLCDGCAKIWDDPSTYSDGEEPK